ncbi:hypothetical protein Pcinc_029268 [Petrolisthes cinctipes]|uniref:Uncharacterized protein n=1 Tax=Petrolisthes cinctipes TaxID=88211 RepID=A0AAE1F1A5_PETCI|nr:hypothetical protein Pcinc_029268 [Petrolisthes cinctipes]
MVERCQEKTKREKERRDKIDGKESEKISGWWPRRLISRSGLRRRAQSVGAQTARWKDIVAVFVVQWTLLLVFTFPTAHPTTTIIY